MPVRQHILSSQLKNCTAQKQKGKNKRAVFLECFIGAVVLFVFIIICKNFICSYT